MEYTTTTDVTTGDYTAYVVKDGLLRLIAKFPSTKWKAFNELWPTLETICESSTDLEVMRSKCQALIDSAPAVPPGHISAQVFDPLKMMRKGMPLGDLLERGVRGDLSAYDAFPSESARQSMIYTFGSHVVRMSDESGNGLGSGVLIQLPTEVVGSVPQVVTPFLELWYRFELERTTISPTRSRRLRTCRAEEWESCGHRFRRPRWAIMTCSHVWDALTKREKIQIYCACTPDGFALDQKIIEVPVDELFVLDMQDTETLACVGLDSFLDQRDVAVIVGNLNSVLPRGVRVVNLSATPHTEPEREGYALVGYPLLAMGNLHARFIDFQVSNGKDAFRFTPAAWDADGGSVNGASGGLIVSIRGDTYRPIAMMLEEAGDASTAAVGTRERQENPSTFRALGFRRVRDFVERAGILHFRDRHRRPVGSAS